jgi:hypothetical protein
VTSLPPGALSVDDVQHDGVVPSVARVGAETFAIFSTLHGSAPVVAPSHVALSPSASVLLRILDLPGCNLGDKGLAALCNLFQNQRRDFSLLERVNLRFNSVTDTGAAHVAALIRAMDAELMVERQRRITIETARVMQTTLTEASPTKLGSSRITPQTRHSPSTSPKSALVAGGTDAWSRAKLALKDPTRLASVAGRPASGATLSRRTGIEVDPSTTTLILPSMRRLELTDNDLTDDGSALLAATLLQCVAVQLDIDLEGNDLVLADGATTITLATSMSRSQHPQ